ncbi:MAG: hypothetical protein OEW79_09035 [Betaproteobacteria bacterium]|nr:hypothetical protein [Betaproteobacteria bacterium]MDH5342960.1 hypothetical protein [Betaproteobacteria bacterium]
MSKAIWFVAGALTVVLAIALNPSPERHRDKIKESIAERSQVAAALQLGSLTAFVSNYHSLVVASYTTVNDKVQSFGLLGMMFVTDSGK